MPLRQFEFPGASKIPRKNQRDFEISRVECIQLFRALYIFMYVYLKLFSCGRCYVQNRMCLYIYLIAVCMHIKFICVHIHELNILYAAIFNSIDHTIKINNLGRTFLQNLGLNIQCYHVLLYIQQIFSYAAINHPDHTINIKRFGAYIKSWYGLKYVKFFNIFMRFISGCVICLINMLICSYLSGRLSYHKHKDFYINGRFFKILVGIQICYIDICSLKLS
eukprot:TRINITY_DN14026_c0_g3_i1.p1 TRINITY_DN14026_c0_g3~~TRINITY_DN14026_c0_g3_i1.p1  ORF type:complete len:221 (-),score=-21.14 TRINITY_DN14026_c0_g3_i1:84-746(-)